MGGETFGGDSGHSPAASWGVEASGCGHAGEGEREIEITDGQPKKIKREFELQIASF